MNQKVLKFFVDKPKKVMERYDRIEKWVQSTAGSNNLLVCYVPNLDEPEPMRNLIEEPRWIYILRGSPRWIYILRGKYSVSINFSSTFLKVDPKNERIQLSRHYVFEGLPLKKSLCWNFNRENGLTNIKNEQHVS